MSSLALVSPPLVVVVFAALVASGTPKLFALLPPLVSFAPRVPPGADDGECRAAAVVVPTIVS